MMIEAMRRLHCGLTMKKKSSTMSEKNSNFAKNKKYE